MERPAYDAAIEWFAREVPELAPIYRAHLEEWEKELPYAAFETDYMGWLKRMLKDDSEAPAIDRFLDCVETCLAGPGDELSNLVAIGFVEHLECGGPEDNRVRDALRPRMGPTTVGAFQKLSAQLNDLWDLKAQFGHCRCKELGEVVGPSITFYQEHLVWVDEYGRGLNGFSCPNTGLFWLVADLRGGYEPRMERFEFEEAVEKAARGLQA